MLQDEYLEWPVFKNEDENIKNVIFTCDGREVSGNTYFCTSNSTPKSNGFEVLTGVR